MKSSPALLKIKRETFALFKPPTKLTVSTWAEQFRYLSRGETAEPGPFSFSRTPFARDPCDSISDPNNGETVLMMCRQVIKTECILNGILYLIDQDPCPILVVYSTL